MRMTTTLGCALLIAGCLAGPAHATQPTPMTAAGSCEQVAALVPVQTARLAPYVPAGFPIVSVLGRSPLIVTGGRCDPHSVDGAASAPNTFGLVMVLASHPDSPFDPNGHAYDLWWQNSERSAADGYRALGVRSERVRSARVTSSGQDWSFDASAARRFPVRVNVRLGGGLATPGVDVTTFHWHSGRYGRVLIDPFHTGLQLLPGVARITAPAGTPVADILGARQATGAGAVLRFAFAGEYGPA